MGGWGTPTRGESRGARLREDRGGAALSKPSPENALDHVVVVMFENRSFDNLLGRLYEPGEVASFEDVIGKDLSNPVPEWVEHGDGAVPYGVSPTMNTPDPDSGEEFPHINTQLFGILDEGNLGVYQPESSFNAPRDGQRPTMDGFVADYTNVLLATLGRQPTRDEYAQIMMGYSPEQMPVMSALARGFATFDHWFCDVPTCTFPNRSFFHAGSSSGYVVNMTPADSFPAHNTAETLFERLESAGLTWKVYCDPPSHYSLTGIIHAPRLHDRFATNFVSTSQFGFAFDRAGVRVPTLAISAWIPERTVVSDTYLGTSLLATMRERWNLGAPFTARDASAASFARVHSLSAPRPQEDWPDVSARPVPEMPEELFELDAPLGDLGYALVSGAVALARSFGKSVPDTKPDPSMPGGQALALAHEALGDVFPLLRGER